MFNNHLNKVFGGNYQYAWIFSHYVGLMMTIFYHILSRVLTLPGYWFVATRDAVKWRGVLSPTYTVLLILWALWNHLVNTSPSVEITIHSFYSILGYFYQGCLPTMSVNFRWKLNSAQVEIARKKKQCRPLLYELWFRNI